MASSDVEICNSALRKLGASRIITLSDSTKNARLCQDAYPLIRDEELAKHPWNFALLKKELAELAASPLYDFDKQYQLPLDVLRVVGINSDGVSWVVEGRLLLTDLGSPIQVTYIRQETDVSKYSPFFVETLAWAIAKDLAYAITQSSTLAQLAASQYKLSVREARSYDAQEGRGLEVAADTWTDSRF